MQEKRNNRLVLYADEFHSEIWEEYCDICGVPYEADEFTIYFNDEDVEYNCEDLFLEE